MKEEHPQLESPHRAIPYRLPGDTDEDMARKQAELDASAPAFRQRKQQELAALKHMVAAMCAKTLAEQTGDAQMT